MIDLHSHILPGVDDGPSDMEESLDMCRRAEADGITTMVATPHCFDGIYGISREAVGERVRELNARLDAEGIRITVLPGAENHACTELPLLFREGGLSTINDTNYVLVEFPVFGIPQGFDALFFELRLLGARIVIAHPERYHEVQRNPEALRTLVDLGALVQVTASSLCGQFGRPARKCAQSLLRRRMVHLLASDAHSRDGRPPELLRAVNEAAALLKSEEEACLLVRDNPLAVLLGEELPQNRGAPAKAAGSPIRLAV
ncbi:tyrosine-protein phosphatase [Paucidesulfovibrio longus]|uniref:tyrosine-protein phosphatase n=1 Tax=Paucidesulfovibrio longus TaxID=889 RepID=UPI0003B48871|nr:CpsB/CapC family capsule biosynthesis tyrosine phosphatase [Paucidesulfovibrio longus]